MSKLNNTPAFRNTSAFNAAFPALPDVRREPFNQGIGRPKGTGPTKRQLTYQTFLNWVSRIETNDGKCLDVDSYLLKTDTRTIVAQLADLLQPTKTALAEIDLSNVPQHHNKFKLDYALSLLNLAELKTVMHSHDMLDSYTVDLLCRQIDDGNQLYDSLVYYLRSDVVKENGRIKVNLGNLDNLLYKLNREFEHFQSTAEIVRNMESTWVGGEDDEEYMGAMPEEQVDDEFVPQVWVGGEWC